SGSVNVSSPDPRIQSGQVLVQGDRVQVRSARIDAAGQGQVGIIGQSQSLVSASQINLSNLVGIGGLLRVKAEKVMVTESTIRANGIQGGGVVQLQASQGRAQLENSELTATSRQGTGGRVEVLGDQVEILASRIDVSGAVGGEIYSGGDYQGQGSLKTAQDTVVDKHSKFLANGLGFPNSDSLTTEFPEIPPFPTPAASGGTVILWADDRTRFYGQIQATGYGAGSRGGFVEVSGKETLIFRGEVNVGAVGGESGTLLLDPTHITIVDGSIGANDTELSDGIINTADGSNSSFTIAETTLEAITGNIILQASDTIQISDLSDNELTFASGTGSITFTAGRLFTMNAGDTLRSQGRDLTIEAGSIITGNLNTSGRPGTAGTAATAGSPGEVGQRGGDGTGPNSLTD
ncbi:MAG: hypothetical protein ACO4CG_16235, partial [Prochlorothrix sp.]